jgi:hypothetical protein
MAQRFKEYCVKAHQAGRIDSNEWAYPKVADLVESQNKKENAVNETINESAECNKTTLKKYSADILAEMSKSSQLWSNPLEAEKAVSDDISANKLEVYPSALQVNGVHVH